MPTIILLRHSEPDYTGVEERKFIGHGIDLAPLTEHGIQMAEKVSWDSRLNGAELIVSSPYTRALQTAAIIAKNRQLDIKVELDLHEWIPDLTFQYASKKEASAARKLCLENKGICPDNSTVKYEDFDRVFNRAKKGLLHYNRYSKIIVVTHGIVMRRFDFLPDIPFCGMVEIDFNESFSCTAFNAY